MNPEHSLEFPLKNETEGALSHPSINEENSNMAAFSETSNDDSLSLDPLMDIKIEPEVFCESNEDDKYSYEMNSVVNEKDPLTCKKEVKQERRNSQNAEKRFRSTDCEKAFNKKIKLTSHSTNPTREKPFICKGCGKAFSRKKNLTVHMRIHTGEKPFMCKECGTAFPMKHHLADHMRIHTDGATAPSGSSDDAVVLRLEGGELSMESDLEEEEEEELAHVLESDPGATEDAKNDGDDDDDDDDGTPEGAGPITGGHERRTPPSSSRRRTRGLLAVAGEGGRIYL
ncbi:zinc finger and SCAN domain-containing protein 31-like [Macrobrachium rosenbergii]|uniref:zinc finger and SCAN domain-containing protein 31-like n=1 Tax=Macrobrachium rosenbergii TaxID=79674 RepID=UPI0034D495D4